MSDWFTAKDYAAEHGVAISTARKRLTAMAKRGELECKKVREVKNESGWGKYEQRPIVAYFREKDHE